MVRSWYDVFLTFYRGLLAVTTAIHMCHLPAKLDKFRYHKIRVIGHKENNYRQALWKLAAQYCRFDSGRGKLFKQMNTAAWVFQTAF